MRVTITYRFKGCYEGPKGGNWDYSQGCPARFNDYCTLFNGSLYIKLKKGEKYPRWCPIKKKEEWSPLKDGESWP
jgi:hypothetical protein